MNERNRRCRLLATVGVLAIAVLGIWGVKELTAAAPAGSVEPSSLSSSASSANEGVWNLRASSIDLEELQKEGVPIMIDFGSDECVPCKEMAPVLEKANGESQGKALVKFVDVWDNPSAANGFPVQVIPTQVFFDADGSPYVPSEGLAEKLGLELLAYEDKGGTHVFTAHQGALNSEQLSGILADMGA